MKKVLIDFSAVHTSGGEKDLSSGRYTGLLRLDSGAYVLTYSEGAGAADVAIRIFTDKSAVKTQRFDRRRNCLLIQKGKITRNIYKTDFGDMQLDTAARCIDIKSTGDGVNFIFSYDIIQNSALITRCEINIKCKYVK
ncbi:MAG: DUF1934 domain-containing protein [Clostridiales bacterium]|nr:DUF1934 domain-containing protein [Clostridiales bacterium]